MSTFLVKYKSTYSVPTHLCSESLRMLENSCFGAYEAEVQNKSTIQNRHENRRFCDVLVIQPTDKKNADESIERHMKITLFMLTMGFFRNLQFYISKRQQIEADVYLTKQGLSNKRHKILREETEALKRKKRHLTTNTSLLITKNCTHHKVRIRCAVDSTGSQLY